MSYRTPSAETLMDILHTQEAMYAARLAKATDKFEQGLFQGWLDCTKFLIEVAPKHLERVESDAELLPSPDAEQWLEESMAGDYRDFPSAA